MDLEVGQRWSFHAHEVDDEASVVICSIEPNGIHVSIQDLSRTAPDGQPSFSGTHHTPIARESLERSLDRLIANDAPVPDGFAGDIDSWKAARGGFFTMTVAEIIAMVRDSGAHQTGETKVTPATGYIVTEKKE